MSEDSEENSTISAFGKEELIGADESSEEEVWVVAQAIPKNEKIIEYETEKPKYIMPPNCGPGEKYTVWDLEHLLNLWK